MSFACQTDSYCKEYWTEVLSCEESDIGPSRIIKFWEVILTNTILFPEGGGQPCDHGSIDDFKVVKVTKRGQCAVHLVSGAVQVGATVRVTVNWRRRFDHMQQHTGQHLITAVTESELGFKTTAWNLGDRLSFVELDTTTMSPEQVEHIERICNEKIREHLPVNVTVHEHLESDGLQDFRSRLLSKDHAGPIRVVSIQGIDENTCCGTHVSNLSHLQAIKLLYVEKGKKNKSNLYFLVGDRVLRFVSECVDKDKQLTSCLNGAPDRHVVLVDKIQKALKTSQKNELLLLRDLASLEVQRFKSIQPQPKVFSLHRREGNADFINSILKEIDDVNVLLFVTVGEERSAGQLLLSGNPELVDQLGPKVLEILDAKGATQRGRLNGKIANVSQSRRSEVEQFLRGALNL